MARQKQQRLPGVEGSIPELEKLAYEYAAVRDKRMELTEEEVKSKAQILEFMGKRKINNYKYDEVTVERVPGKESVKVRVAKKE